MLNVIPALLLLLSTAAFGAELEISAGELQSLIESSKAPYVLDVRTPDEFRAGHVPGAYNIPHDEIASRLEELSGARGRDVVVYCRSGRRAGIAASALTEDGFRVLHLDGDMNGWAAEGRPLEMFLD